MKLVPYLLDQWLGKYRDSIDYHVAASTGPKWTLPELRALMTGAEREEFDGATLTYCPTTGRPTLRAAIASIYGAAPEDVLVFSGGAEALLALFFVASEPGANIIVPWPAFPPFVEVPRAFGLETRRYRLRQETEFAVDVEEIMRLTDARTELILLNSPHNPSGAVVGEDTVRELEEFAAKRGIALIVDEVYHPIYHGVSPRSAGQYSRATVLGDFSKSFSLPGLRIGWLLERDPERRRALESMHGYFLVSSSMLSELLAEVAARNREVIWNRTRDVSAANLALLEQWLGEHEDRLEWLRPSGGMTAFPRLRGVRDARPFCEAAAKRGVLVVPGDCFGAAAHLRIGFGVEMPGYAAALDRLGEALRSIA